MMRDLLLLLLLLLRVLSRWGRLPQLCKQAPNGPADAVANILAYRLTPQPLRSESHLNTSSQSSGSLEQLEVSPLEERMRMCRTLQPGVARRCRFLLRGRPDTLIFSLIYCYY